MSLVDVREASRASDLVKYIVEGKAKTADGLRFDDLPDTHKAIVEIAFEKFTEVKEWRPIKERFKYAVDTTRWVLPNRRWQDKHGKSHIPYCQETIDSALKAFEQLMDSAVRAIKPSCWTRGGIRDSKLELESKPETKKSSSRRHRKCTPRRDGAGRRR